MRFFAWGGCWKFGGNRGNAGADAEGAEVTQKSQKEYKIV